MASIAKRPNGGKMIQFFDSGGKRRAIQLGRVSMKNANSVRVHVERLVAAQISGSAVDDVTSFWLKKIDQTMIDKLAKVDLIKKRESADLGKLIDDFIKLKDGDVKPRTVAKYRVVKKHLIDHFGKSQPLRTLNAGEAKKWRAYLVSKGLAENSIRKLSGIAKTMFNHAVENELLVKNPFRCLPSALVPTRERHFFLSAEDAQKVIDACPDDEWKLIVALARYGGLRTPSETFSLKWQDVNWEQSRFYVPSPKTERYAGKEGRIVPIFPELRPYLDTCFFTEDKKPSEYVIAKHRVRSENLRTTFHKIIKRAGLKPWPKPFQNLRSSRETELIEQFPIQTVVSWIGNSPTVALQSYLQVRESDFEKALHISCSPVLSTVDQA
ncbi:tyrosine-type recombinase/integrase [Gimesia maris]|uniref:Phage integrase family protein n=1 Tax=Gimesia maris TaxID=122 RepID=A0ABX5YIN8_9PLAN|nr:tyrosine-type recombinase/integrase [Gimesia maris]QEG15537.1 Phage integrase family protein [Gimesia maris]QGQ31165.1 tyrosine-type recombinase/integrase [Gimesia maris]